MDCLPAAWIAALVLAAPAAAADEAAQAPPLEVRAAVEKGLPLLLEGARGHIAQKTCFACHNQATAVLAFTTARARGFDIPDEDLRRQREHILRFLGGNRENYRMGRGQGGQIDTAGYALFTLELAGAAADETTAAVAEYLLLWNKDQDHWRSNSNRPPSEASHLTVNYLAVRGLQAWATAEQKERAERRIAEARAWLLRTPGKDTEDRVFRLWALRACGASERDVLAADDALVRTQRPDGSWGQLDGMAGDAYATGSALAVLHLAGGMKTTDPVYQRGLHFLLRTQRADGSWTLSSRSKPFQPYYESGFPHGKNQFISMAASGWAVTALALAFPPEPKAGPRP